MLRLLTITLNPALDRVYEAPDFAVGKLNRARGKSTTAGGKGINVARAYRALGGVVVATGLVGGRTGGDILAAVQQEGIPAAFVNVASESRVCIKIADPISGSQTEINEPGPSIAADEYAAFSRCIRELIPAFDVVVLTGSVPPGLSDTVYGDLVRLAQEQCGVSVLLDAGGEALRGGAQGRPKFVKPNIDEAKSIGIECGRWEDTAEVIRERFDIPVVLVTAGKLGAVLAMVDGIWLAVPPPIVLKSPVGSGDALTAGLLSRWNDDNPVAALKWGVAAGAVNATSYMTGEVTREAVAAMVEGVTVTQIG